MLNIIASIFASHDNCSIIIAFPLFNAMRFNVSYDL